MRDAASVALLKKLWASGHNYLIEERTERAQEMLAHTDLSLSEIAFTTPREFRRSLRQAAWCLRGINSTALP
jgi:transcriptional regulator GlxA family with amidase domain